MNDNQKTKKQLVEELQTLRTQIHAQPSQTAKPQETTAQSLLTSIDNIGHSILSQTNLDDLLDVLCEEVITTSIFRSLAVFLVDKATREIRRVPRTHKELNINRDVFVLPLNTQNIVGIVARTNQAIVIEGWDDRFAIDTNTKKPAPNDPSYNKFSYFIPISQGSEVIAIFATGSDKSDKEQTLHHIQILQPLFNQLAVALRYTQLIQQTQQQASQLQSQVYIQTNTIETQDRFLKSIDNIGQAILSSLDIDEILDTISGHIVHTGVFRSLTVALIKEKNIGIVRTIYPKKEGMIGKTSDRLEKSYPLDSNKVFPEVVRTGKLVVIDNGHDKRLDQSKDWEDNIAYFFPVKSNNKVQAVLATGSTVAQKTQTLQKIEAIQPLLGQLAIAIQNAQLHQEIKASIQIQEMNLRISNAVEKMKQKNDLNQVLYTCLTEIRKWMPHTCSMALHRITDTTQGIVESFRVDSNGPINTSPEVQTRTAQINQWQQTNLHVTHPRQHINLIVVNHLEAENPVGAQAIRARFNNLPIQSIIDISFSRGVLCIHSTQENAFSEKEQSIFKEITETLATGLARLEDLEHLSEQTELQSMNLKISDAVQKMTSKEDLHEVLKTIFTEIKKRKSDVCALSVHHIIEKASNTIETFRVSTQGTLPNSPETYRRPSLITQCQNLETLYILDTEDWDALKLEAFKKRMNHLPIRSFIDIPIERGALSIHSENKEAFTVKDIDIFQTILNPLSLGIARLEDLAYLQDHNKKQNALLQINRTIQSMITANDLEHVIQTICTQMRLCQINFAGMSIHRILNATTHLFETFRLSPAGTIEKITRRNHGAYKDWKNGQTIYRPDTQNDPQGLPTDYLKNTYKTFNLQVKSMLNVPFPQGILVLRSDKVNAFSPQDIRFIEQISETLSLGIARTEDLQSKEIQFQELENVYRFSPIGLFVIDKDLRLLRFNEKLAEINGLVPQDLGKTLDEIVPEQIRERRQQFEHVFETGEPTINLKVQGYTPKEPTVLKTWLANYYPLKSTTGKIDRILGAVVDITQQEEIQEQLRLNEARLKQAMQVANIGIWNWDIVTDQTTWWGDMFQIYGITPDEFTGNGADYLAFTHPDDREIQQKNIQLELDLATAKNPESLAANHSPKEFRIIRPDGSICTVEGDAIVETNSDGKPIRMLGVLIDITNRKNSEKALQESEHHLRLTLSAVPIGILLANTHSEIIQSNEAALDLLGLTEDELLGKTALDPDWNVLNEEGHKLDPQDFPIPQAIRTKTSIKNIYMRVYRPKTQDRIDLMVNADVLKDEQDNVKTVVCSFMDITELRQTTKALQQSDDLLKQAQHLAHLGSWTLNMATDQVQLSEELCSIYGLDPSEALTTFERILEIVHPEDRNMITENAQRFAETGIAESNEFRIIRPNGDIAILYGQAEVVTDAQDKVVGLIGTVQDITERKQMELERERTQRLRALGEMAAGISHNLNNILTGVLGPAQMLQLTDQTPQNREEIDTILTAGIRARDIVSRINKDWGTDTENLEATHINTVIQEAIHTARPRWKDAPESRGLTVELHQHLEDVPHIQGTPSGLYDIIINLIFNAVDAMPQGGRIALTTTHIQNHVRLLVSDTGTGMSEEILERIFNPFFTTKGDVGTGLGLSTVYGTINRWGGKIDVSSTVGQGTTFTLDFPIWKGEEVTTKPQTTSSAVNREGRILIVDDEDIVTRVLKRSLPEHHVDVVSSSSKALEIFTPNTYDILITDLGLPHLPGDQLANQLRQKDPLLTTILISGWELLPDDPRRVHFDFFVQKPFHDLNQFRRLVAEALDRKGQNSAS